jgi:hypothetical protein
MGCISLVRCMSVLHCGLAGVVWYPDAGWSTASACILPRNMVYPALLPLMLTPRLPVPFTLPRNTVYPALLPLMFTPRLPVPFTLPRNTVYPALLPLMRTPRLPVPFTLPRNTVYPALPPLMRTPRLPVVDWTDYPADLNELFRFAERRNLVSALLPSHYNWSLMLDTPGSEVVWRVLATHSIRQFPVQFPSRASPCGVTFLLDSVVPFWGTSSHARHFRVFPRLSTIERGCESHLARWLTEEAEIWLL